MIAQLPIDLFVLVVLFVLSAAVGRKLLVQYFRIEFPDAGTEWILSVGIGLLFYSTAVFIAGMLGAVYGGLFIGFFGLSFVWCFDELKRLYRAAADLLRKIRDMRPDSFEFLMFALIAVAIIANFVFNYSPPVQTREMMYDLTLPKIYLENHKIIDVTDKSVYYYPFHIHMLYLLAMAVRGALLAKLIHFSLGILCLLTVYQLADRFFGRKAALFASAIFYLMPMTASLSGTANIDFGTLLFGLLSVSSFLLWIGKGAGRFLYLGAFFSGAALGTKVTGMSTMLCYILLFFLYSFFYFREPFIKVFKRSILVGCFCFFGFSSWIVRNIVYTDNPVMPIPIDMLGWSGHENVHLEMDLSLDREGKLTPADRARGYHNILFGDFIYGGGPLVFAFLLPAFISGPSRRKCRYLAWAALLNYVLLFNMLPQPNKFYENRYYMLSYVLCAIISGEGMRLLLTSYWRSFVPKILIALCLFFPGLLLSILFGMKRLPVFFGIQSAHSYVENSMIHYGNIDFANKNLPEGSRVLEVGGAAVHAFYWDARVVSPLLSLYQGKEGDVLMDALENAGITHLIVFKYYPKLEKNNERMPSSLQELLQVFASLDSVCRNNFEVLYEEGDFVLYRASGLM